MRGNIIEELYYGNIDPQDRGYCPKNPAKKASDSLNDLEEKLTEQLAGANKELFLRFCNAYAEFMGESELDTFITGFRLGARFMMDTFFSDDAPFEGLLEEKLPQEHNILCYRLTFNHIYGITRVSSKEGGTPNGKTY